jgi:predicted nucleic acid-binding protein
MAAAEPRPSGPAVLIDTPLWRDYFRREEKVFPVINALMDAGRVCSLNFIIAELVAEAATEEESEACRDFRRIFPILPEPGSAWIDAAAWARKLQKRGRGIALRDAYVAWMAKTNGVRLWTRNPLFSPPAKVSVPGLKIFAGQGVQE